LNGFVTEYLEWRLAVHCLRKQDECLLVDRNGAPLRDYGIRRAFARLRVAADIMRHDGARYQPRLHDLRHSFTVDRLTEWYREGKDVQKLLPALSTYLGHNSVAATQVYLTMTPELLRQASRRFQTYALGQGEHD
jgi:integrase/recombinase XerD